MTTSICPKCRQVSTCFFKTRDYNRRLSDEVFNYYRCATCDLIFLSPIPADLQRYYPDDYYAIPVSLAELAATAESLQRWKLDLVQRVARPGRLMEIGPAYGLFAYLAKQAGFTVETIERDARCCRFLNDVVGIKVIESSAITEQLQNLKPFNVIALWQVIEHLPDPWAVLTAAAERLTPDGVLVLDTPNPGAFQFRVLGRYWTHVDAPRHIELIPAPLLVKHMAQSGLHPVWLTAVDKGNFGFNSFGWAFSLKNFFMDPKAQAAAHFAGRVLSKLLIPIERTDWRGSTYTAVFKKEGSQ